MHPMAEFRAQQIPTNMPLPPPLNSSEHNKSLFFETLGYAHKNFGRGSMLLYTLRPPFSLPSLPSSFRFLLPDYVAVASNRAFFAALQRRKQNPEQFSCPQDTHRCLCGHRAARQIPMASERTHPQNFWLAGDGGAIHGAKAPCSSKGTCLAPPTARPVFWCLCTLIQSHASLRRRAACCFSYRLQFSSFPPLNACCVVMYYMKK